jgi:alkylation response protein AidB-like acyl-CoA dehydrogenase
MDFDLSEEQLAIQDAVRRILAPSASGRAPELRYIDGSEVERALKAAGFYEVVRSGGSELDAVLVVEAVAMHAASAEFGMTTFAAQVLNTDLTPPTVVTMASGDEPVRFLSRAQALIYLTGVEGWLLNVDQMEITRTGDTGGYSLGTPRPGALLRGRRLLPVQAVGLQRAWRLVSTAEILGAAQAALDLTLDHVKERRQFGRAIGSFQAVQHRLAEIATSIESLRLITYRAALSQDRAEAALALGFGQEVAARISYDCHQFHGALGQSLECPLHYFTDRMRALQGECGGYPAQYFAAGEDWKDLEGLF